jgi:pimeloyl-ACP methyl ester carboxylesterase
MLDLADELRGLLDVLSVNRVHLLGISKGSLVGQAFLIRHPARALSFCGLGNPNLMSDHVGPAFSQFSERLEALREVPDLWPQRISRDNYAQIFNRVYVPALFLKAFEDLNLMERARAAIFRRMVYPAMEGTYVQSLVDLFEYYMGEIAQEAPAFAEGLPDVRGVPILLLNGTADTTTPVEMSRELADLLPEAELIEMEGITHMGPMALKQQAEAVFERYVTFMKGKPS